MSRYIQPGQAPQPSPPAQANSYIQPGTPPQAMPSPPQSRHQDDAAAFIVSANLERRNLSKGQQAMALALIYPKPARGRGNKDEARKGAETASFQYRRVQEARTVLDHSRALAEDVMANRTSLDAALKKVEDERCAGQSVDQQMAELRAEEARDEAVSEPRVRFAFRARAAEAGEYPAIGTSATVSHHWKRAARAPVAEICVAR